MLTVHCSVWDLGCIASVFLSGWTVENTATAQYVLRWILSKVQLFQTYIHSLYAIVPNVLSFGKSAQWLGHWSSCRNLAASFSDPQSTFESDGGHKHEIQLYRKWSVFLYASSFSYSAYISAGHGLNPWHRLGIAMPRSCTLVATRVAKLWFKMMFPKSLFQNNLPCRERSAAMRL